jgi:ribosome-associated protein
MRRPPTRHRRARQATRHPSPVTRYPLPVTRYPLPVPDLPISSLVSIPAREISVRATRAGGPGGQHVNTSATRIEVTWNVDRTQVFDAATRARLRARLGTRVDADGDVRVVAANSRSQLRNREAAEARLAALVARALIIPKRRRPTRPTAASKRARLEDKRRRSDQKRQRRDRADS